MNATTLRSRARDYWRKEIRPLLILALVVFSIRSSLADWNDVPTGSMKPTVLEGDHVYMNKVAYDLKVPFTTWHLLEWDAPRRGDIVVFYSHMTASGWSNTSSACPVTRWNCAMTDLVLNGQPVEYGPIREALLQDIKRRPRTARARSSPPNSFPARRMLSQPFRVCRRSRWVRLLSQKGGIS